VKTLFSPADRRKTIQLTELAQLTGFKSKTLYEWVKRGEVPAFRQGKGKGRRFYFHRAELEIWWSNLHHQQRNGV
jgi:excisionase family DNA binding protein